MKTFIRATCVDTEGKRYPEAYALLGCDRCTSRFRKYAGGGLEPTRAMDARYFEE